MRGRLGRAAPRPDAQLPDATSPNGPGPDDDTCLPTGTTGAWHAASGNSGGWQEWKIDLTPYAGKQVELSIVFATDWSTLTVPGMLVDDTKITLNGSVAHETSFETDHGRLGDPRGAPEGPAQNANDWERSQVIFEDAAVTKSEFGLMFGFGLEGVDTAAARRDLMQRTLGYLLSD